MAFVRIAKTSATTSDGATVTTGSITTTGATLLVAVVSGLANSTFTMADSKSNTWTALTQQTVIAGLAERMYYCLSPTVGAGHTFTGGGGGPSICVSSYSGSSPALDQTVGAIADYPATSAQPGSLTPSVDNCLLMTGIATRETGTVSINSTFTITDQVADTYPTGGIAAALAEKIQTTAGAENPTWSWSVTAFGAVTMAVFKLSGGGGGGGATFRDDPNYSINYGINLGIT